MTFNASAQWRLQTNPLGTGSSAMVGKVQFVSATEGWIDASHSGSLLHTTDGGNSWNNKIMNLTQYGFYPYFMEPIFKITGMGLFQMEWVFSGLLVLFFIIILFLISRLVKSRVVLISAMWVIPGTWLWMMNNYSNYENFYQYWPNRILFPSLVLLLIWLVQKTSHNTQKILTGITFLVCAIGVLWNFDTGIIAFLCWMIFLIWDAVLNFREKGLRKSIQSMALMLIASVITLVCAYGFLDIFTYLRSGHSFNFSLYAYYQSIFVNAGFFMLPMPGPIHMWNLVLLVYAVGIYLGIIRFGKIILNQNLIEDQNTRIRNNMILIVSIMGCGLFSYYQGRSHDANLLAVSWSFWFLILIYADLIIQKYFSNTGNKFLPASWNKLGFGILGLFLAGVLSIYTGGIISLTPGLANRVQYNLANINLIQQGHASEYNQDVQLIKKYFKPNNDVVILSNYNQAYLYIESGMKNPLTIPSFGEIFLKSDYQKVVQYLANNKNEKIVLGKDFSDDFPGLSQQVIKNYKVVEEGRYITIYKP